MLKSLWRVRVRVNSTPCHCQIGNMRELSTRVIIESRAPEFIQNGISGVSYLPMSFENGKAVSVAEPSKKVEIIMGEKSNFF